MTLDPIKYYRLPWNYADNAISWLEPTTRCNLQCEGCYRDFDNQEHKTLDEVRAELELFSRVRKSDCMSIAGGDPLVYPHIVELVGIVKKMGWKPIINTNGIALDKALLRRLKDAGVYGFTIHVDSTQRRPDSPATTETGLNELRLKFARMLHEAGGISCSFNSTVSERTLPELPALVEWAKQHAEIVQTMVFILFRSPGLTGDLDYFAGGEKIELANVYKETEWAGGKFLMAQDVVNKIREAESEYEPCAFLNGTARPDSFKWLLANRTVFEGKTMGYMSPKIMELVQTFNHLFTGRYLSYASPCATSLGKSSSLMGSLFDGASRRILFNTLKRMVTSPAGLFRSAHMQTLMVIQPINFEEDGRQDMCDSCPDITIHEGKLVWSCRMEELRNYGRFLTTVPKC
jgi:MoaA/NifB/PqqE/SkfB family radical SAM enzyme